MKLEQERADKEHTLAQAKARLAANQPPTDECEHEWLRLERDRQRRHETLVRTQVQRVRVCARGMKTQTNQ